MRAEGVCERGSLSPRSRSDLPTIQSALGAVISWLSAEHYHSTGTHYDRRWY